TFQGQCIRATGYRFLLVFDCKNLNSTAANNSGIINRPRTPQHILLPISCASYSVCILRAHITICNCHTTAVVRSCSNTSIRWICALVTFQCQICWATNNRCLCVFDCNNLSTTAAVTAEIGRASCRERDV